MSALPFRATTPQQAPQHQANGRLSAETLCHANRRSSPSAPSLFAMRRSISNQAESSQHHTFEWLNEQSPMGKKQMLVDPRHKTSQGQKGGFCAVPELSNSISQGHHNRAKGIFSSFNTYTAAFS